MTLLDLAVKHGTDKVLHGYIPVYERVLSRFSGRIKLLEIGVYHGASLRMWADYFPEASIVGLDINRVNFQPGSRIESYEGNQSDPSVAENLCQRHRNFDIIIDDGSHKAYDAVTSLINFFPLVNPGGLYIIEDTLCSYWEDFGGGLKKNDTIVELCKDIVDDVNLGGYRDKTWTSDFKVLSKEKSEWKRFETKVLSISFYLGMIVIEKR